MINRLRSALAAWLLLAASPSLAVVLVDYPLDTGPGNGWNSSRGQQEAAEAFTLSSSATLGQVDWFGYWQPGSNDEFDVLFYADAGGAPENDPFASQTIAGLSGVDTGQDAGVFDVLEWSTPIASLVLTAGDYWISIRGVPGGIFTWTHATSDGTADVWLRDGSGPWEQNVLSGPSLDRDRQALRIHGVASVAVPEPATAVLVALGLLGAGRARIRSMPPAGRDARSAGAVPILPSAFVTYARSGQACPSRA